MNKESTNCHPERSFRSEGSLKPISNRNLLFISRNLILKAIPLLLFTFLLAACAGVDPVEPIEPAPTPVPSPMPETEVEIETSEVVESKPTRIPAATYDDLEIVTLLPRDGIPAIDNPQFLSAANADEFYDPDELVIGVDFNEDARAYSIPFLSNREIVNDTVGGVKIAVTW